MKETLTAIFMDEKNLSELENVLFYDDLPDYPRVSEYSWANHICLLKVQCMEIRLLFYPTHELYQAYLEKIFCIMKQQFKEKNDEERSYNSFASRDESFYEPWISITSNCNIR